jgi:hypothetical protein
MRVALLLFIVAASWSLHPATAVTAAQQPGPAATRPLDFEYFRTKVQPILLAKREGHTRCVACHSKGTPMRLQELSPGAATWDEEQSRKNFQVVLPRVVPSTPNQSKLLLHPLLAEGGGTFYHTGGKHWSSFLDPEWQTIANWICGRKSTEETIEFRGACE